jgi:UDP-glucuronate decarboxylase
LKTNVFGALNVLNLAKRTGARVFQASTSEVYGDPEVSPQPEGYWGRVNPFGPRACYDEGKRTAETLFYDFHHTAGVDIRIARIFNTYGPRMGAGDGRVVSNFIVQALTNSVITIYGDGTQTRSFCYVDDLVDGILGLMDAPVAPAGPVNLGNDAEITILELAETIIDLTGSASRIKHSPLPEDDPRRRRPDISLARRTLGWTPRTTLTDGLRRTIAYHDGTLRSPDEKRREEAVWASAPSL